MNPIATAHLSMNQMYDDMILLLGRTNVKLCHWANLLLSALKHAEDPKLRAVPRAPPVANGHQLNQLLKRMVFTATPLLPLDDPVP